ncbi:hypothetical protein EIN_094720 [Entamoeba invadens IP1]|uniref:Transmembrane protein n=1 Tax=Entamoeba invadens IP1 TaxID=370355 RepID=A0A0A1U024_ENTIV|nr:hypothetical protein EIN_094720 [Entamoeba invadens IP1]ELP87245.1 hypothetical protein EIN_094720 [Entamoeba invadens IP1]|eukprot:XP_004254016.1 hypothetical protein EIN_094720 [Entamoeba invadens IP1]
MSYTSSSSIDSDGATSSVLETIVGYVALLFSVLLFGSFLVPVKKFEAGDGLYYQFVVCSGIFISGVFVMLFNGVLNPGPIYFEPYAMVGGLIFVIGNLFSVPIIQCIGISLGPCIWGAFNLVTGWVTGTFGLFGLNADKNDIQIFWLNCIGALLSVCSVPLYALIKVRDKSEVVASEKYTKVPDEESDKAIELYDEGIPQVTENVDDKVHEDTEKSGKSDISVVLNEDVNSQIDLNEKVGTESAIKSTPTTPPQIPSQQDVKSPIFLLIDKMPKTTKKIVGVILSVISGMMYGSNLDTPNYLKNSGKGSPNGIDYVFSQYCGIMFSSTFFLLAYCIVFRNKPIVYSSTTMPALIAGVMWGLAQALLFYANTSLPYIIVYPIVCTLPSLISSLWGIVVFKEIFGWRNFMFFAAGTLVLFVGIICIVISR